MEMLLKRRLDTTALLRQGDSEKRRISFEAHSLDGSVRGAIVTDAPLWHFLTLIRGVYDAVIVQGIRLEPDKEFDACLYCMESNTPIPWPKELTAQEK